MRSRQSRAMPRCRTRERALRQPEPSESRAYAREVSWTWICSSPDDAWTPHPARSHESLLERQKGRKPTTLALVCQIHKDLVHGGGPVGEERSSPPAIALPDPATAPGAEVVADQARCALWPRAR